MEKEYIIKKNEILDHNYGSVNSLERLLLRYLELGRCTGKTFNLSKMLKKDKKYLLVLHNNAQLRDIFYQLDYNKLMTPDEISQLKNNVKIFVPYIHGKSIFDTSVFPYFIRMQSFYSDYEVLIDNAVIDKEIILMNQKILNLIIKKD